MSDSSTHSIRARWPVLVPHLGVLALGALTWPVFQWQHAYRFAEYAQETLAVLDGRSFSPAFASRVLAPALLKGLVLAFGWSPETAFAVLVPALWLLGLVVNYEVLRRAVGRPAPALAATVLSAAAFMIVSDPNWLKPWDFVEYALFNLFAGAVLMRARLHIYLALFAIGLLNRETALLIPLWLCLSSLAWGTFAAGVTTIVEKPRQLVLGAACCVVGVGAVSIARRLLWIPADNHMSSMTPWGNHFEALDNVFRLQDDFVSINHESVVLSFILVVFLALGWRLLHSPRTTTAMATAIALLSMVIMNLLFSIVDETRVWLICIPMAVAFFLDRRQPDAPLGTRVA